MRKCLRIGVAFVLTIIIAGCGSQASKVASSGGTGSSKSYPELRWGITVTLTDVEFRKNIGNPSATLEHLVVQSLVEFEADGKVKLGLAKSVEQPNPTTYIYKLKPGVRFSDGKLMTAADVVYSLDLNEGKESQTKTYWEDVSSVSSRGSSTVVVKLKRPNVLWPEYMAETGEVIEKAAAEKVGEKTLGTPNGLPIGTGPWKFDSFKPEVSVTYSRNPYWSGPPQPAAKITISSFSTEASLALAMRSGAIDGMYQFVNPKLFVNLPNTRILKAPSPEVEFVAMNTQVAPFSDVHVRRAVGYAADVEGMLKAFFPGGGYAEASRTIAPADLFDNIGSASQAREALAALPKYEFNLAAARRELAKSAYPHGFTTTIRVPPGQAIALGVAQVLAADLAKIGIIVKVNEFKVDEYPAIFAGKLAMMVEGYPAFYPDPEAQLSLMLPSSQINPPGSGVNLARFRDAEVDRLMAEQRETSDASSRLKLLDRLANIVAEKVPYRPLYSIDALAGVSDKFVYPTFSQWSILFTPWAMDVRLAS